MCCDWFIYDFENICMNLMFGCLTYDFAKYMC
jgi:hypothetical protein